MNPTQNLYHAPGQLAYAVAVADGQLQKEGKDRFHKLIMAKAAYISISTTQISSSGSLKKITWLSTQLINGQ